MKKLAFVGLLMMLGLSACQKQDSDTSQQDKTTTPHSMDKDQ
ncbi:MULTISPECIES: hypothetical protein [unclassified Acinetobacter]|jgi:hypothetical protein|nr:MULTISPECIES: hypothetical protein [unclassified Acinetobacter]